MRTPMERQREQLNKREAALGAAPLKSRPLHDVIYDKVPTKVRETLEEAFAKAFQLVFLRGTDFIEKTFSKEDLDLEFQATDYILEKKSGFKQLKRLDRPAQWCHRKNNLFATVSGMGLGLLGIGVADIPLFVGTMLKGVYQTATSYGVPYNCREEQVYVLRLIATALSQGEEREKHNARLLEAPIFVDLEGEIRQTAAVLSDAMLLDKFVQGLPIVGIVGGAANYVVYKKVAKFAALKYKQRYLEQKG